MPHKKQKKSLTEHIKDKIKEAFDDQFGGELVVSGKDDIMFELADHHDPEKITVYFDDLKVDLPCNPGKTDMLTWSLIKKDNHKFNLKIMWDVEGTRVIVWKIIC